MTTPIATPTATLDHAWIAAHIPHAGSMCVLDRVEAWDAARIRCSATSHRDPHNPLRARGRLASVCGIEYAAQAMAVHGALLGAQQAQTEPARPRVGYLASVRGVDAFVDRLDTFALPLLDALAARRATRVVLDYLEDTRVQVDIASPDAAAEDAP